MTSGTMYRWIGVPGQYDQDDWIRVDSMTASCGLNAAILNLDFEVTALVTIPLADFEAAVRLGFLVEHAQVSS